MVHKLMNKDSHDNISHDHLTFPQQTGHELNHVL